MPDINDGGAAFPVTATEAHQGMTESQPGMSLRDWFAGQALSGTLWREMDARNVTLADRVKMSATLCYQVADAMLAARKGV